MEEDKKIEEQDVEKVIEDTSTTEETTSIPPIPPMMDENGNPITPPTSDDKINIPLDGLLGGGPSPEMNKVFDIQKQIFDNFDKDITSLKEWRNELMSEFGCVKDSLTATKLYIKLLSKAIIISDFVFLIIVILLIIFK